MSNNPILWLGIVLIMGVSSIYHMYTGDIEGCRYYTIVTLLSFVIYRLEFLFREDETE
jgi:hypothetical protein